MYTASQVIIAKMLNYLCRRELMFKQMHKEPEDTSAGYMYYITNIVINWKNNKANTIYFRNVKGKKKNCSQMSYDYKFKRKYLIVSKQ